MQMMEWVQSQETVLWCLVLASIVMFLASVIIGPWWIIRLPADYFVSPVLPHKRMADRSPVSIIVTIARNIMGGLLILAGILMLVLPGQGLLAILVGILLMDFPGKHRLARWIVARPPVLHSINWLRHRAGKDPMAIH